MEQKPLDQNLLSIDLLIPDKGFFAKHGLKEVKSLAIFEPNSDVFHNEGLFSQEIFGQVGSRERIEKMGYVEFVLPVLHPLVFKTLCSIGDKYDKILKGELLARFDESIGDFVPDVDGETGFNFFLSYIDKIQYENLKTKSLKRDNKLKLLDMYGRNKALISSYLVIPAGLREYVVDEKGQPSEDEINPLYRILIGLANRMKTVNITPETITLLDPIRYKIQKSLLDIYRYIESLIDGKKKFIQSKFASRAIQYSTRNVITSIPSRILDLDQVNEINFSTTIVGLFQYLKALGPIVFNKVISRFLMPIMGDDNSSVYLINKDTLKLEQVTLSTKAKQTWTTADGINNTINKFIQGHVFNEYVTIDDHFLYLRLKSLDNVYVGDPDYIKEHVNQANMNSTAYETLMPSILTGIKRNDLELQFRPITYAELFYLSIVDVIEKYPALVTRYPITGNGSIYPSLVYVKTTNVGLKVTAHLQNGEVLKCSEYPLNKNGIGYFRSLSVHYTHLKTLGADHDGDALTFTLLFTDEAIEEAKKIIGTKDFYLNSLGNGVFSPKTDILDTTLKHLTSE